MRDLLLRLLPVFLFDDCRWYRKLHGGHWERWFAHATGALVWVPVDRCIFDGGPRPGDCWHHYGCEDYR